MQFESSCTRTPLRHGFLGQKGYQVRDRSRKIVHKQIKNDAGVIMSTAENRLELSVKISVNTKTQIPHVVRTEGLSKNQVPG